MNNSNFKKSVDITREINDMFRTQSSYKGYINQFTQKEEKEIARVSNNETTKSLVRRERIKN